MNYQKLYTFQFNRITDALQQLENSNYGTVKEILKTAQTGAEELYLDQMEQECAEADAP